MVRPLKQTKTKQNWRGHSGKGRVTIARTGAISPGNISRRIKSPFHSLKRPVARTKQDVNGLICHIHH